MWYVMSTDDVMLTSQSPGPYSAFFKGGPKPKILDLFANFAQQSCTNEVSPNWPGSRACLRALEALGFFIPKYAFSPF